MKKLSLDPLKLDKNTIASLNSEQLSEIVGGQNHRLIAAVSSGCGGPTNICTGQSAGCGGGGSTCFAH
ncbi:putative Bacteriocin microcin B17 [Tenacibaculum sp. 190524A02b]|uniref:Bacteriocin microcin B17 n=1 Tax=Tenacibaculum vairaonense TaxID=3137860 RepID=A0ABM9PPV0_9FLAO